MNVLVTGANGFLGTYLIDLLLNDGHSVLSVGRTAPRTDIAGLEFFPADIGNIADLRVCHKENPSVDVIIHLAAFVPQMAHDDQWEPMFATNVVGTGNLLEVFGKHVGRFVYGSTAEVYGLPTGPSLISESLSPAPLSFYGASKLSGEHLCGVFAHRDSLSTSILRFAVMYGPGDTIRRAIPNFIERALRGEPLDVFGGEELRDYLHVRDAAMATYLAADEKLPAGIFNIGTGVGVSIKSVADAIANAVDPGLTVNIRPRRKRASDIVLDAGRAERDLLFSAQYRFPDLLQEQIEWHRAH